jgi:transposase
MRKTKEILRLKWQHGRSHRQIAAALAVGDGTPSEVLARAKAAGLTTWPDVEALTNDELDARLYPPVANAAERPLPDPAYLHVQLRRTHVTLRLLHEEYLQQHPDGYGYTKFLKHYGTWADKHQLVMRQVHKAGEKCFVDYAGKKPAYVNQETGERVECELFVAVMGATNYTYAEATASQKSHDWISSHVRLLEFLGGVPDVFVPDQLKSGVVIASRYEPAIQRTYQEWSQHYSTTIMPARPASPRDKAKVEVGVLVAERWILARLRNITCFSIGELNEQIARLLEDLNNRIMRRYKKSRRELFTELDKPVLAALPPTRFGPGDWTYASVGHDYHVRVERDGHDYSVPYTNVGDDVEIRVSASMVEVFTSGNGERIAAHARSFVRGGTTTLSEHMPQAHRKHRDESAADLEEWAQQIGPCTHTLVRTILDERRHPEHGLRTCRGLRSLTKRYTPDRLEAACERALVAGARSYLNVESILKHGLDKQPLQLPVQSGDEPPPLDHENIRGPDYYH